jgi:two-component system chemotaxis response regulator CheB
MNSPVRVLVVDDSALARRMLSDLLNTHTDIEVVGTAQDGKFVLQKIEEVKPDVVTLDVEMRNVSGLDILPEIVNQYKLPVIMVSAHTDRGAEATLKALEYGAVDFVTKPQAIGTASIQEIAEVLAQKIVAVAGTKINRIIRPNTSGVAFSAKTQTPGTVTPKRAVESVEMRPAVRPPSKTSPVDLIAIGASTGGTEAIKDVITRFPANLPGIVITQHMPPGFTKTFAQRLDSLCSFHVKEAEGGELIATGTGFVAPGGKHLSVIKKGGQYYTQLLETDPVNRHKPSVDVLYDSVREHVGSRCLAVILTGMGADGADGLKRLKDVGAYTIAQDEQSCVVFGMPKEAIKRGGATKVMPLLDIGDYVSAYINSSPARKLTSV